MESIRIQKKLFYIIIAFLLIGVVALLLLVNFSSPTGRQKPVASPTPLPVPTEAADIQQSTIYKESVKKINQEQEAFNTRSATVGQLIKKLPYRSDSFTMNYSYEKNQFTVILITSQGEADFDAFLRANGIQDRSWIKHLVVTHAMKQL